jgi:predicted RNA-binding Zn-ribbon protein involved in translation (DUF1610 family)
MKIKQIISQTRRDFHADYECEGCGNIENRSGYDDRNFHDNVIPKMKCSKCGESTISLGAEVVHTETKYQPWETV